ncbi:Hint domain-containing protein [Falsirhodobacter deserti]|uniref:Hint domain-containing protein n=1 Tax=Falsirhodobacter deserti TaxID=1365611 RepID=UPI003BABC8B5
MTGRGNAGCRSAAGSLGGAAHGSGAGQDGPISFTACAIDNDTPLQLSPQHRVLIRDSRAGIMFGEVEVLLRRQASGK